MGDPSGHATGYPWGMSNPWTFSPFGAQTVRDLANSTYAWAVVRSCLAVDASGPNTEVLVDRSGQAVERSGGSA